MLHRNRVWSVTDVVSPEELAHKLTQQTWTGCSAFRLGQYLFANDATCADGAQEYAILRQFFRPGILVQVESMTFSWCRESRALELINQISSNHFDSQLLDRVRAGRFQTPEEHDFCSLCL